MHAEILSRDIRMADKYRCSVSSGTLPESCAERQTRLYRQREERSPEHWPTRACGSEQEVEM